MVVTFRCGGGVGIVINKPVTKSHFQGLLFKKKQNTEMQVLVEYIK